MSDTYSQIYIHIIFAVKGRTCIILPERKDELYKYISGIVSNHQQKLIAINGMGDHIHILSDLKPKVTLSAFVRDIKANSSRFINEKKWIKGNFDWQHGFGAFSVSQSQLSVVINYIQNQESHHKTKSFKEEYIEFLKNYKIDFKPEYIFADV